MRTRRSFGPVLIAVLLACGCAGEPSGLIASGDWGGTGVALTVTATGATLEFDCAHGTIPGPLRLDDGRFTVNGVFVLEHGGPVREGELPDERPARYEGSVSGALLRLTVRLEAGDATIGSYTLRQDQPALLRKCL
jgi:hypothetical protein